MKRIIFVLFLLSSTINAQDYFPLQVGNSWTYAGFFDTTSLKTFRINDTVRFGNNLYFLYGPENVGNDTIRQDEDGCIWKLYNGQEVLWFDFTKDSGDVYTDPIHNDYEVWVAKNKTARTHLGNFANCIEFVFLVPGTLDSQTWYWFAPEVGLVLKTGAWVAYYSLFSATINNVPVNISKVNDNIPSTYFLAQNYPNPFNSNSKIQFSIFKPDFVTLEVYNLLGQKMVTLVNEKLNTGTYTALWNATGFASGVYLYRMQAGNYSETKKLILLR